MTNMQHDETPKWLTAILCVARFGTLIVASLSLIAFLARAFWAFEYACHFRLQYVYFLAVAVCVFAASKRFAWSTLASAFCILNLAIILPFYMGRPEPNHAARLLRLVTANVGAKNPDQDVVVQFVRQADADFVALFETGDRWRDTASLLAGEYPYSVLELNSGNFSIILLSRFPLIKTTRKPFARVSIFGIVAECDIDGQIVRLVVGHVLPPYSLAYQRQRNEQLAALADEAAAFVGPVLLAGDMNVTPWSPYFSDIVRRSGLRDSRRGFGVQPTWPASLPGLRIPIDHCLVSSDVGIHNWRRGPRICSDHLPIVVDFWLKPGDEAPDRTWDERRAE